MNILNKLYKIIKPKKFYFNPNKIPLKQTSVGHNLYTLTLPISHNVKLSINDVTVDKTILTGIYSLNENCIELTIRFKPNTKSQVFRHHYTNRPKELTFTITRKDSPYSKQLTDLTDVIIYITTDKNILKKHLKNFANSYKTTLITNTQIKLFKQHIFHIYHKLNTL